MPLVLVNIQAAPIPELSFAPPIIAVFPSALIDTLDPCVDNPIAPEPIILEPCCVHMPLVLV